MIFVFTGPAKVDGVRIHRDLLIDLAYEAGHYVEGVVEPYTDYVVASSPDFMNRKGSKLRRADKLGITVISPEQFMEMMGK